MCMYLYIFRCMHTLKWSEGPSDPRREIWHTITYGSAKYDIRYIRYILSIFTTIRFLMKFLESRNLTYYNVCHREIWHTLYIIYIYMTHSYVCHDSFLCVPWLIPMCAMTHSCVCHVHIYNMTYFVYSLYVLLYILLMKFLESELFSHDV